MTTIEYNQIKENFKPAKLVNELQKTNKDIADITSILQDLAWKRSYLSVKATAKTLDEAVQQLKSLYKPNL